jgi:hypothetical protein
MEHGGSEIVLPDFDESGHVEAHPRLRSADRSPHDAADAVEAAMLAQLDRRIRKSVLFMSGATDPTQESWDLPAEAEVIVAGDDPRLRRMPETPALADFFRLRFAPSTKAHLLQSAMLALKQGHEEKVVLACLLHDISMAGFIRGDHGYWGAQLVEPYVDEEVTWAIRAHQALRFFPDESVGYHYPESYVRLFGEDYVPPKYVKEEYERARRHRWYMTGRLITLNDLYSFDPDADVSIDDFVDIIGRNFRQPPEGLGFDGSPVAHMWRTMIWPTRSL